MTIARSAPTALSDAQRQEAARLYQRALQLQDQGTPSNTRRAYEGDWKRFEDWCSALGLKALPASIQTVILYITHLADPERVAAARSRAGRCKPSTIDRALSAIAYFHRARGFISPRESVHIKDHIRKTKVALKQPVDQAAPMLIEHLAAIVACMPATEPVAVRDKALLLLGWAGALRRSELAGSDRTNLTVRREGLLLRLDSSKTDQEGVGIGLPIARAERRPELCPVTALQAWLAISPCEPALFCRTWYGELVAERIPDAQINTVVQRWTRRAQLTPENPQLSFSAHSLRAGFITEAVRAGVPEWMIMQHTRHESYDVFRSYIRGANPFQDNPGKGLL